MRPTGRPPKPRITPEPEPVPGCRWVPLTRSAFALVDEADFERVDGVNWRCTTDGYATSRHGKMHRVLFGAPPADMPDVDHINGDGLDNRRANLRWCDRTRNLQNARRRVTRNGVPTSSHFKGVHWVKDKARWRAEIGVGGRRVYLGKFASEVEAARAYDTAAEARFGAFAKTNFSLLIQQGLQCLSQSSTLSVPPTCDVIRVAGS